VSTPRFLFTARLTADAAGQPRVAWRLVGGNNHELGRSVDTFTDLADCVAGVEIVRTRLSELVVEPLVRHGGAEVAWRLRLDDAPVAAASRWYRRVRESEYNLDHFRTAVPIASVAEVLVTPPARRELLRPEFVIPHLDPDEHVLVDEAPGASERAESAAVVGTEPSLGPDTIVGADATAAVAAALTQDLPVDQVDELTEAS
jgi:hypothetical protein